MAQNIENQDIVPAIQSPDTSVAQLQTFSQAPTVVTQYAPPTIQNGNSYGQVYATTPRPQVIYTTTPVQTQTVSQQQPNVQNSNHFTYSMAQKYVTNLEEQAKENKTVAQTNAQQTNTKQVSETLSNIDSQIRSNAEEKIKNIYEGEKQAEEEKQKEFERLKKENEEFKKEEEARKQKEENDKKLEDERSEIENREKELDEREDFLQSMEHNSQIDKEDLDIYKEQTNQVEDLQEYGEPLKNFYEQQIKIHDDEKKQKSAYIGNLEKEADKHLRELTAMEKEINDRKARENIITKIINFLTGKKDKKSEELKEKIKKLSEDIKTGNTTIEQQKQEFKAIEKKGLEIMKNMVDEMKQNSTDQIKDLKEKKQQYDEVKNTDEYKSLDKAVFKNKQIDRLKRRQEQIDLINSMALKRSRDIYTKYNMEQPDNKKARYSITSINNAKSKTNGRY